MHKEEFSLSKVFSDAGLHRKISGMIARHLSNKLDIRQQAFDQLDLSATKDILDLGCGFGFFTEALGGKVHPEARITGIDRFPEYEWFYFQSCERAGIKANFRSNGIGLLSELPSDSYDLILCSYAMYFFPEYVGEISRILKPDGLFIAITHALPHMEEFCTYVRGVLKDNGLIVTIDLPYESLISRFSDQNGVEILEKEFKNIKTVRYKCKLNFGPDDHQDLIDYFNFKHHFFIPQMIDPEDKLHAKVISRLKQDLKARNGIEVTKNDVIFVCRSPHHSKL